MPSIFLCFENKKSIEYIKKGVDEYDDIFKQYVNQRETNVREIYGRQNITASNTIFSIQGEIEFLKQQKYIYIDDRKKKEHLV